MCNRSWFASRASFVVVLGLTFPLFAHAQAREHTLHAFGGNCWLGQQIFNLVSGLAADSKGNLYGARSCGSGEGDIFESSYDPHSGWRYAVIYTFPDDGSGGVSPQGALTVDNVGNLYGTTYFGGANGCGVVYELMPDSSGHWTETVLYSFGSLPQAVDGCGPTASVVFDQAGNLYGTATGGGANNYGVAFELSPTSTGAWSQTVLHSFGSWWGPDGSTPWQGLVLDQSGNLYGTTPTGGKYTYGTVFELSRESDGTWNETPIHEFTGGSDGAGPNSLVFDSRGNLYGPSGGPLGKSGGGQIYQLSPAPDGTWTETVLHVFQESSRTILSAPGQLSFDDRGILYGPLDSGGGSISADCPEGCGGIFRLIPGFGTKWSYQQIYGFTGLNDGGVPSGPLIFDERGKAYGTTSFGGSDGVGTVFQIYAQ